MRPSRILTMTLALCLPVVSALAQKKITTAQTSDASPDKPSMYVSWGASPPSLTAGSTTEIILTAPQDKCSDDLDSKMEHGAVHAQTGLDVTVVTSIHSGKCEITTTLKADSNATQGSLRLTITDDSDPSKPAPLGQATIEMNSLAPGPVPPGLEPQVDAVWQVEDYDVIKQNFGMDLANHYLAVLIGLYNNTGYDLILDGVAFETQPQQTPACSALPNCQGMPNPIPSETPTLLPGVVAYGENYSARNIALRSLQWASLLTTGFIPFFKAPHPSANYSSAIAIFNGPFTNGFEGMFPDLTVHQLQRLSGSGIMGDSNELDNNRGARYLAFLSRSSVCPGPTTENKVPLRMNVPTTLKDACGSKAKSMKPALLTAYLKQLVVVGVKIPPANARFRVVVSSSPSRSTELTPDKSAVAGVQTSITLSAPANSSLDLTGATPVQPDATTSKVANVSSKSKTTLGVDITAHTTQSFTLQLQLKDRTMVSAVINVALPAINYHLSENTLQFQCDLCQPEQGTSSDWRGQINLVWSGKGTSSSLPRTISNITQSLQLAGVTPSSNSPVQVKLIPVAFVPNDQGVAVQITGPR